jgi:voltage-gated potassium channel
MFPGLRAVARDPEGKVLLVGALSILAVGTVVYMLLEGWSFVDALYFCVVTLATVGFGDLHPTTDVGKLFTVLYILSGIGIIVSFASELAKQRHIAGASVADRLHRLEAESAAAPESPDRATLPPRSSGETTADQQKDA